MKRILFFLSVLFAVILWQSCEKEVLPGSIYGVVTDKATGEPIKSAGVELNPGGLKTVTGSEGQFEFVDLTPGKYNLIITKTGYIDFASSTIEVKEGQTAKSDAQIEMLPPALKVVDDNRKEITVLDFGKAEADVARSFNLFNDGVSKLEWQITATAEWIKSVSKTEGELAAGSTQSLIITIDRSLLSSGENMTTVHITSNNGSKQLTVKATNGLVLATLNTLPVTDIKTTSVILNAEILTNGSPKYSERGFVYSLSSMPTIENSIAKITSTLTDSTKYSATLAGLTKNQTYYVRAYAINLGKEAYSTNEVSFTTSSVLPQVSTQEVTNIARGEGRATFIGNIMDEGDPSYTERGFVYGTTHNPMIDSDTKLVALGKGVGEFSANAQNLEVGKIYFVRAYATNEQGIAYGEEVTADFTAVMPEIKTLIVTDILRGEGKASFWGNIISVGDPVYTERGFVYGIMHNPTIDNDSIILVAGNSAGEYTANISDLQVGLIYYLRAYAKNDYGITYGDEMTADFTAIMPEVETVSAEVLNSSTVYLIGKITKDGDPKYTERGFIYGTMHTPTYDDSEVTKVVVENTSSTQFEKEVFISGLNKAIYYIRAYAKNSEGVSYGEIIEVADPAYLEYIALPTFIHSGSTYRVYPDFESGLTWQQAKSSCNNLTYGGYSDWFLPSKSELNTMYLNKDVIGGFSFTGYCSSSYYYVWSDYLREYKYYIYTQSFISGEQYEIYIGDSSSDDSDSRYGVRCIRLEY